MENLHIPITNIVESSEFESQTLVESRSNNFQFPIINGLLRRHQPLRLLPPSPVPMPDDSTYKECLRNHAASIGGLALDGCGGYIACPSSDPSNPLSLKCLVCGCHRNFHRSESTPPLDYRFFQNYHANTHSPNATSPPPFLPSFYPPPPYRSVGNLNNISNANNDPLGFQAGSSRANKRYRTKFSGEQKLKMQELADKIGWKMQKGEEGLIGTFCSEIGVQISAFKIWMHNNKNTLRKRDVDCLHEDTDGLHFEGTDDNNGQDENVAIVLSSTLSENKTI